MFGFIDTLRKEEIHDKVSTICRKTKIGFPIETHTNEKTPSLIAVRQQHRQKYIMLMLADFAAPIQDTLRNLIRLIGA
jgi:hypothetical protein